MNKKLVLITIFITTLIASSIAFFLHNRSLSFIEKKHQSNSKKLERELAKSYKLNYNGCTDAECLFHSESTGKFIGNTSFWGYYSKTTREGWSGEPVECDSFTITSGRSNEIIQSYVDGVNKGNTVNSLDDQNQPIVNLQLSNLSSGDLQRLKNSNTDSKVRLDVFLPNNHGRGAPACFSYFQIKKVQ